MLNPAGTSEGVWDVTATAQDVVDFLPAGDRHRAVRPTSREYYQAIVQAFARGAALTVQAGSGLDRRARPAKCAHARHLAGRHA